MRPDRTFRRNFFVITGLHVVAVVVIYVVSGWHRKSNADKVMWLEGGSIGGDGGGAQAADPAPEPPAPSQPAHKPPPPAKLDPPPPPLSYPAPGDLVLSKHTPHPATPTPKPATPRHITPKPTPKHTPKPKPATPKPEVSETDEDATPKPKPSPQKAVASEKPAGTPIAIRTDGNASVSKSPGASKTPGASGTPGSGSSASNGPGNGNGKGPGKSGNGSGTSEFGWYFSMIHDRFHSRWDQPTTISRGGQDIVTTLRIRISKDGAILSRDIVKSSGDATMDGSVMTAAERVQQIDPLPAGLGNGDSYEVNIAFKLDQGQ